MIKYLALILLFFFNSIQSETFNFLHIPIQEEGRIKPLDSFARNQLLKIYGKTNLTIYQDENYEISAIDWLYAVLRQEPSSLNQSIFKIQNPDVVNALNLDKTEKLLYSFNQINTGLSTQNNIELIQRISKTDKKFLTLVEKQILDLNIKHKLFLDLFNSASCIIPIIQISNPTIAQAFGVSSNDRISYFHYIRNQISIHHELQKIVQSIDSNNENELTLFELKNIMETIAIFENEIFIRNQSNKLNSSNILKIIPSENEWQSVWNVIDEIKISGSTNNTNSSLLLLLEKIFDDNDEYKKTYLKDYYNVISLETKLNAKLLKREVNYNQSNLFIWSLIFYILSLISLFIFSMFKKLPAQLKLVPFLMIGIGFLYHLSGIVIRMTILERPPVSTLYESVIFVGLIAVFFCIILEYIKKDNLSIYIGSISGIILHYISFGYAADGDTLGVLVAVLNSNFWLATHVTTITVGYAATVICSLIGHLYLLKAVFNPKNRSQLKTIYNNMLAMTFIALFFTMFGTILGGIWGDQSWGRFWGWDPKENGALLIVMWLLMMIHLKISGMVKAEGYALGLVLANITVALAWFGVNLLSVGLHSYGFTDGAAFNLFAFILFEVLFGFIFYGLLKYKKYY